MKARWSYARTDEPKETPVLADSEVKEGVSFRLKCVACFEFCDVLFQGTSYCFKCLHERVRTGLA
jgi:hypothetical protein